MLDVRISDLARGGAGVARDADGKTVFVPRSIPGDEVRVRILKSHKRYQDAEIVEILKPSPLRETPKCEVFENCGGCEWQHVPYPLQWKTKVQGVVHALKRSQILPPFLHADSKQDRFDLFPAKRIWNYRNRVQLRGESKAKVQINSEVSFNQMGFYRKGSNILVPTKRCEIASDEINQSWEKILQESRSFRKPFKVEISVSDKGFVETTWNSRHADKGFQQINSEQNGNLISWIHANLSPSHILFDFYSGSGNLSIPVASKMKKVLCVDTNARKPTHCPENVEFFQAPVLNWVLKQSSLKGPSRSEVNCSITDPPRLGMGRDFLELESFLRKNHVSEWIVVGCDVDQWCYDLSRSLKRNWKIERVALFDFFPHTPHLECAALLKPTNPIRSE